jgi:large subunit ribosomal protein L25
MADVKLAAETRTEFGKGAARRIRRDSKVPAVVYGHGAEPVHITLPGHELQLALRTPNVLITLDIEGKTQLAIPKAVQRDAIKGFLEHVDLLVVTRGEKVNVEVYVHTEGELAPGAYLLEHVLSTLNVEAEATHIPESVELDVEGMEIGSHVLARDLKLPSGTTLQDDEETLIVHVVAAPTAEELEEELAEAEAEAGIEREESEEELEAEAAAEEAAEEGAKGEAAEGAEGGEGGESGEGEGSKQE